MEYLDDQPDTPDVCIAMNLLGLDEGGVVRASKASIELPECCCTGVELH